jgi:DNA-binding beta-propeller fold protein YncE
MMNLKKSGAVLFTLLFLLFLSCAPVLSAQAGTPPEAGQNGAILPPPPPIEHLITFNKDSSKTTLTVDGSPLPAKQVRLAEGWHILQLKGKNIKEKTIDFYVDRVKTFNLKSDPPDSRLTHLNTIPVGSLPKGAEFTKDGKYLFISLLGEPGLILLEADNFNIVKKISHPEKPYSKEGFVEVAASPWEDAVLASQMTTASIHRIPLTGEKAFEITESVPTRGNWSKVIAFSESGKMVAVSNWTSWDVSLFTYPELEYIGKVPIKGIPRGLAFADDDKSLYVTNYSNGSLHRIDLEQWKVAETIPSPKKRGALRHLAFDRERNILYASDMLLRCVNIYDLNEKKLVRQIPVDYNTNTIALSPDNKYLYVSCRGPNAKTGYLDRSPRSGTLYMIDCEKQETIDKRTLGNQPTALAVHPSGKYVVVSNFRDKNIEVYLVDEYAAVPWPPEEPAPEVQEDSQI